MLHSNNFRAIEGLRVPNPFPGQCDKENWLNKILTGILRHFNTVSGQFDSLTQVLGHADPEMSQAERDPESGST